MKRYSVTVYDRYGAHTEVHQADSWQSAIPAHSKLGAEFDGLNNSEDLTSKADTLGIVIFWSPVP